MPIDLMQGAILKPIIITVQECLNAAKNKLILWTAALIVPMAGMVYLAEFKYSFSLISKIMLLFGGLILAAARLTERADLVYMTLGSMLPDVIDEPFWD